MRFVETLADPIPKGATSEFLAAPDGTRFRVAHFGVDLATQGTVVILTGRTEFIEKYFEVIGDLMQRGYAVATLDWRGQGLSDRQLENPHKGHVDDFDLYVADLRQAFEEFIAPVCPSPYRMIAHSMGGTIGLLYLHKYPDTFANAMFSAPMWGVGNSLRAPLWIRGLSVLANGLGKGDRYLPFNPGDYGAVDLDFQKAHTSDESRFYRCVNQVAAEPRLELGSPTVGWLGAALRVIDRLHGKGFVERIETPVWVCTGGADTRVSAKAQAQIAERLPQGGQIVITGARHEMLMERDELRDFFFKIFDDLG